MIELLAIACAGFVAFFVGLLRWLPLRPGERDPEHLFAIVSIIVLLLFAAAGIGLITDFSWGRIAVFYSGTVAAYFLSRLIPRREREAPPLPPEYVALSRQADATFKTMKNEVARGGEPSQRDALKLESYAKRMAKLDQAGQEPRAIQQVKLVAVVGTGLFLIYLVIAYLNV